jgi:hypothetical protein
MMSRQRLAQIAACAAMVMVIIAGLGGTAGAAGPAGSKGPGPGRPTVSGPLSTASNLQVGRCVGGGRCVARTISNRAFAANFWDDREVYGPGVKVATAGPGPVNISNTSVATASCDRCRTASVALLAVYADADTTRVQRVDNVNRAFVRDCNDCEVATIVHTIIVETNGASAKGARFNRFAQSYEARIRSLPSGLSLDDAMARVNSIIADFDQAVTSA